MKQRKPVGHAPMFDEFPVGKSTDVDDIDVLPLGSFDMQIRAGARAALQRHLARYFWGSGSDIKIMQRVPNIIRQELVEIQPQSVSLTIRGHGSQPRGARPVWRNRSGARAPGCRSLSPRRIA